MFILPYVQITLGVIMTALILLQQSDAGLGAVFGGSSSGAINRTRRGAEKTIFQACIVVSILFVLSIMANFIVT